MRPSLPLLLGACHVTSDGCIDAASASRNDSGCRICSSATNEGLRCGTEPGPGDGQMLAGLDSGDATALNDGVAGAEGDKNGGVQGGAGDMPLPPG